MFRKNIRTWLSEGGYFTPTPDTLFVSPERHALLNKFTQSPHDSAQVVEVIQEYDRTQKQGEVKIEPWFLGDSSRLLTDMTAERGGTLLPGLIPSLPFAEYGYFIKNGGLLDQAVHVFNLLRTQKVAQLSFLITPLKKEAGAPRRRYPHSRYNHMLDVAAMLILMTELLRNELTALAPTLGFGEGEVGFNALRNTLITGGAIHDALTVAGGDGVKFVDPAAFDEDKLIVLLMELGKYRSIFFDTWSVHREALRLTIIGDKIEDPENSGKKKKRYYLLNHLLDLADKLCYTSRDVWQYVERVGYDNDIGRIITDDPDVCSLWKSIKIVDGKLVVTNYRRLGRFLRLRVLMFHNLYEGMDERSGEIILGHCLCGFMYDHGDLNMFRLLDNHDDWLGAQISRCIGVENAVDAISDRVVIGGAWGTEGESRSALFHEKGDEFLGFVEPFKSLTKSATDRFFVERDGKVGPFNLLYPSEAGLVHEIHGRHRGKFRGYGLDLKRLGVRSELRKPLRAFAEYESRLVCDRDSKPVA